MQSSCLLRASGPGLRSTLTVSATTGRLRTTIATSRTSCASTVRISTRTTTATPDPAVLVFVWSKIIIGKTFDFQKIKGKMETEIKKKGIVFKSYSEDDEEYHDIRKFFELKASDLFEHETKKQREKGEEEKESYWASGNRINYGYFDYNGRHICFLANNSFIGMMKSQYMQTLSRFPDSFGTHNAADIVDALYKNNGFERTGWSREKYVEIALKGDICCYVVQRKNGKFDDRVLRIDLFRLFQKDKDNPDVYVFTSGLFHALKHFQVEGKSLSTEKGYEVGSIDEVVLMCVLAFFQPEKPNRKDNVVMHLPLPDGKCLEAVFYHEKESNVYTITSLHVTDPDDVK